MVRSFKPNEIHFIAQSFADIFHFAMLFLHYQLGKPLTIKRGTLMVLLFVTLSLSSLYSGVAS